MVAVHWLVVDPDLVGILHPSCADRCHFCTEEKEDYQQAENRLCVPELRPPVGCEVRNEVIKVRNPPGAPTPGGLYTEYRTPHYQNGVSLPIYNIRLAPERQGLLCQFQHHI